MILEPGSTQGTQAAWEGEAAESKGSSRQDGLTPKFAVELKVKKNLRLG